MNIKIENKRIIGVDLVKFVACIMVVVLHVFDAGGGDIYLERVQYRCFSWRMDSFCMIENYHGTIVVKK